MLGYGEGQWIEIRDDKRCLTGSKLHVGPVFRGEVMMATKDGWSGWRATLNGQDMGGYPTMASAMARVDWEVWNRVRQMREGYEVLLARKDDFKDAGNEYRSPEYLGIPDAKPTYPSIEPEG